MSKNKDLMPLERFEELLNSQGSNFAEMDQLTQKQKREIAELLRTSDKAGDLFKESSKLDFYLSQYDKLVKKEQGDLAGLEAKILSQLPKKEATLSAPAIAAFEADQARELGRQGAGRSRLFSKALWGQGVLLAACAIFGLYLGVASLLPDYITAPLSTQQALLTTDEQVFTDIYGEDQTIDENLTAL